MLSWHKSKNKNVSKFCDKWPASFTKVKPDFINDLFLVFHETPNQIEAETHCLWSVTPSDGFWVKCSSVWTITNISTETSCYFLFITTKKKQLAAPVRPVGLAVLLHTLGFPLMKQILKRSWEVRRWNWNRFLCSACRDRRIREVWQRLKVKVQTQQNKRINPRNWDQQKQFNSPRKTFTHVSLQGALCTFSVAKVWNDEVTTCHKGARAPRSSL